MLSEELSFWDFVKQLDPNHFNENNQNLKSLCSKKLKDKLKNKKLNFIPMEAMKTRRSV